MADWLRTPFLRSRGQTPSTERSLSTDDHDGDDEMNPKLKSASRVSSYLGLGLGLAPTRPSSPPLPMQAPASDFQIRVPDMVYHMPSRDQIAETLQVVMMNQSIMQPIPIQYNSCVLHLLEGYRQMSREVARTREEMAQLQKDHTKEIEEFQELTIRWSLKEHDYKTEMKKLEVLLSKTENGQEKVTLARTKSAVHGSKMTPAVSKRIGTIKERNDARNWTGPDKGVEYPNLTQDEEGLPRPLRNPFIAPQIVEREIEVPGPDPSLRQQISKSDLRDQMHPYGRKKPSMPSLNQRNDSDIDPSHTDDLQQQQQVEEESGLVFGSFTSTADSVSLWEGSLRFGEEVAFGDREKPLPEIPQDESTPAPKARGPTMSAILPTHVPITNYPEFQNPSEVSVPPAQMSFSFQPGDDSRLLLARQSSNATRELMRGHQRKRSSTTSEQWTEAYLLHRVNSNRSNLSQSSPTRPQSKFDNYFRPSHPERDLPVDFLTREISNSSVITAIRDKSPSRGGTPVDGIKQSERGRMERSSASMEAVTAAATSFAGSPAVRKKVAKNQNAKTEKESKCSSLGSGSASTVDGAMSSGSKSKEGSQISVVEIEPGKETEEHDGIRAVPLPNPVEKRKKKKDGKKDGGSG